MIQNDITIPSAFERLDSEATENDTFVNVRNLQTLAQNHNILAARRAKRPLLQHLFNLTTSNLGGEETHNFSQVKPLSINQVVPIYEAMLHVSQLTKKLKLVVRAYGAASPDYSLFAVLQPVDQPSTMSDEYELVVSGASLQKVSVDLDVPKQAGPLENSHFNVYLFRLFAEGVMDSSDFKAATAIQSVGGDWFESTALGSVPIGSVVYWSDTDIEPRTIISSSGDFYYVDKPFNKKPIPGTDTAAVRTTATAELHSLSIYEMPLTSLELEPGPL